VGLWQALEGKGAGPLWAAFRAGRPSVPAGTTFQKPGSAGNGLPAAWLLPAPEHSPGRALLQPCCSTICGEAGGSGWGGTEWFVNGCHSLACLLDP